MRSNRWMRKWLEYKAIPWALQKFGSTPLWAGWLLWPPVSPSWELGSLGSACVGEFHRTQSDEDKFPPHRIFKEEDRVLFKPWLAIHTLVHWFILWCIYFTCTVDNMDAYISEKQWRQENCALPLTAVRVRFSPDIYCLCISQWNHSPGAPQGLFHCGPRADEKRKVYLHSCLGGGDGDGCVIH